MITIQMEKSTMEKHDRNTDGQDNTIDANHYDFSVIVTNFGPKLRLLRSTVYLLRISDYCRPGTVPHLNIIVII
jgi:hypothetical protein